MKEDIGYQRVYLSIEEEDIDKYRNILSSNEGITKDKTKSNDY